jgi:DNA polymerase-3 subunit gamma/tau
MSYMALARRYRPRSFDEVLGQPSVVRALRNALDGDSLHPALLLSGTRGVGKTTLARILAKALNCETGVGSNPCGQCGACREIDEGRFVDLLEIDAASRTKVEDTRAMLDNVQYAPVRGRYKIYLIDEVHMLSGHSFNALLKTLEEPPDHVKFVLATTDPQKLPVTVLSRCLQLHLRALPEATVVALLDKVLEAEDREAEPEAVALLAEAADGSMRDALSLLDQAVAHAGGGKLEAQAIGEMLGLGGQKALVQSLQAIAAGDGAALRAALQALAEMAVDHGALLDDLASLLQAVAFTQAFGQSAAEGTRGQEAAALAAKLAAADVQVFYDMAVHARRDLAWAPSARIGFEMALLRMWCFRAGAVEGASGAGAAGQGGEPAAAPSAVSTASASAAAAAPAQLAPEARETAAPAVGEDAPSAAARAWHERIEAATLEAYARELARNCVVAAEDDGELVLQLAEEMQHLQRDERLARLREAFGKAVRIERVRQLEDWTPARILRAERARALEAAGERLEASPVFRALQARLGAELPREDIRLLH